MIAMTISVSMSVKALRMSGTDFRNCLDMIGFIPGEHTTDDQGSQKPEVPENRPHGGVLGLLEHLDLAEAATSRWGFDDPKPDECGCEPSQKQDRPDQSHSASKPEKPGCSNGNLENGDHQRQEGCQRRGQEPLTFQGRPESSDVGHLETGCGEHDKHDRGNEHSTDA